MAGSTWSSLLSFELSYIAIVIAGLSMIICLQRKFSLAVTIFIYIFFAALVYFIKIISGYADKLPVPGGLPYIFLVIFLFKGNILKILFMLFFQLIVSSSLIVIFCMSICFFFPPDSAQYLNLMTILLVLVFFFYILLTLKHGRHITEKFFDGGSEKDWTLYLISTFIIYTFLFFISKIHESGSILHFASLIFIIWSFAILCYAIINAHDKTRNQHEANFAREIIASGEGHYQRMTELLTTFRMLRHDSKYHQNVLLDLLHKGETNKAIEYLSGQQAQFQQLVPSSFCENQVINALLVHYAGQFRDLSVEYVFNAAIPDKLPVSDYDICIVIGNLLENALTANRKPLAERKIILEITTNVKQLIIKTENTCDESNALAEAEIAMTKQLGGKGLGLRSVKIVTDNYNGILYINQSNNIFTAEVLLNFMNSEIN